MTTVITTRIGRYKTPVLTFDQCMDLIDQLANPAAVEFKKQCRHILKRFFAGDETLVNEIHANARSASMLSQGCRRELAAEGRGVGASMQLDLETDRDVWDVKKKMRLEYEVAKGKLGIEHELAKGKQGIEHDLEKGMYEQAQAKIGFCNALHDLVPDDLKPVAAAGLGEVLLSIFESIGVPRHQVMDTGAEAEAEAEANDDDDGDEPMPDGEAPASDQSLEGFVSVAEWMAQNRPGHEDWINAVGTKASDIHNKSFIRVVTKRAPELIKGVMWRTNRYPVEYASVIIETAFEAVKLDKQPAPRVRGTQQRVDEMWNKNRRAGA